MVAEEQFDDVVDEVVEELDFEEDLWEDNGEDDLGFARCVAAFLQGSYFSGSTGGVNADDDFFDASVGVLEEIIMGSSGGWGS